MKKPFALLICACLTISMSGCTLGDMITSYIEDDDTPKTEASAENHRVYMDEIAGTLQDFSGSRLTLQKDEQSYTFDVSHATLECHEGMITGDEISVIYEGQLSDTDTSTVKALKVVDEFHKKIQLEEQTATGKIQNLTPNTITLKKQKGKLQPIPLPEPNSIIKTVSEPETGYICILRGLSPQQLQPMQMF